MTTNEGSFDRAARMIVGIQLGALSLSGAVQGWSGTALLVVGILLLLTGTFGYCPLYPVLGLDTRGAAGDRPSRS